LLLLQIEDSRNFQPTESTIDKPYIIEAMLERLKTNQIVTLNNIFFDIDKYDLKPESDVELKTVLQLLTANPSMKIEISGHTDNIGEADYNAALSEFRARSVANYLVSKGVDTAMLVVKGYGFTKPVVDNATEANRALNRRVELKLIK
jgi:outer membrane protein OmpA-like peptidoglycan-associated protein